MSGQTYDPNDIFTRINKIFDMMDADGNGELSKEEFIEGAKMDKTIVEAFSMVSSG